jgi:hypothetical protein
LRGWPSLSHPRMPRAVTPCIVASSSCVKAAKFVVLRMFRAYRKETRGVLSLGKRRGSQHPHLGGPNKDPLEIITRARLFSRFCVPITGDRAD